MEKFLACGMVLLAFSCSAKGTESLEPCAEQTPITTSCSSDLLVLQMYKELRIMQKKLCANEAELEKLKKTGESNKVGFAASLASSGNQGPFSTDVTLIYSREFSNVGNAYKPSTGIFTAPVKGLYFFMFSGHNQSTKIMDLRLFKNGQQVAIIFNHAFGNRYETASNSVSLVLEVGDQVYIRLGKNTWVYNNANEHTTFVGHLVFQL